MKQFVSIDDTTQKGKQLIELLKEFKESKVVQFITASDFESMEDEVLLKSMKEGLESGVAESSSIYKKLGLK